MSDNYYMQLVKAGDLHQLEPLYQGYRQLLMGYFYRRTSGDRSMSEDLVQQVFMRVIKYRHTYREDANFKTWLYQLARNILIDEYRSWQPLANAATFEKELIVEPSINSQLRLEQEESKHLLDMALKRLPVESLELIELCKYQALPYREVGQILGISEANVKVRLHRAIKVLANIYKQLNPQSKEV